MLWPWLSPLGLRLSFCSSFHSYWALALTGVSLGSGPEPRDWSEIPSKWTWKVWVMVVIWKQVTQAALSFCTIGNKLEVPASLVTFDGCVRLPCNQLLWLLLLSNSWRILFNAAVMRLAKVPYSNAAIWDKEVNPCIVNENNILHFHPALSFFAYPFFIYPCDNPAKGIRQISVSILQMRKRK